MKEVTELQKNVITNIKHQMFRHQIDVPDVAAALGMSTSGVYKILAGTVEADFAQLERLARLFKTTVGNLMGSTVAKDAPTLSESLRVIEREAERIAKQPNLSSVPPEILAWLSTAGPSDFDRLRIAIEGSAMGKEGMKAVRDKRVKRKNSAAD